MAGAVQAYRSAAGIYMLPALYLYIYMLPSGLCQCGGAVIQFLAQVVTSGSRAASALLTLRACLGCLFKDIQAPSLFSYLLSKRVFGVVFGELEGLLGMEVLLLA